MCGRFTLISDLISICKRFGVETEDWELQAKYNVAPGQPILAIVSQGEERRGELLLWGLVPNWSKEEKSGYKLINVRKESLNEKKYFRTLLSKQRCIIPADGFYEWRSEGKKKIPFRILMKDKTSFGFAGVWDIWKGGDGKLIKSAAIITTEASPNLQTLHNRMPVILKKEEESEWLNPTLENVEHLLPFLASTPSLNLDYYEVGSQVNSSKNEDPRLIDPR